MSRHEYLPGWAAYRRLLRYVAPFWPIFLLSVLGFALFSLAEILLVDMVQLVLDAIAEMDKVVQTNASSAEESASAAEEMSAQAEQLREFDRVKTDFFNNISHEFRTPLTLILGPLTELIQQQAGSSRLQKQLRSMEQNAQRLLHMVNQLLDFRKLESEHYEMEVAEGDVVDGRHGELADVLGNFVNRVEILEEVPFGEIPGFVASTVEQMEELGARTERMQAYVSPCISTENFEVGPEVAAQFDADFVHETPAWPRPHVDLKAAIRDQLREAGVPDEMLEIAPGVYTAPNLNAAVRDRVWTVLSDWFGEA